MSRRRLRRNPPATRPYHLMARAAAVVVLGCLDCTASDSTASDRVLDWRFDTVWTRGGASDSLLQLTLLRPYHLAVGPDGRIFVLDVTTSTVHILDGRGRSQGTLLSRGSGPGELEAPFGLSIDLKGGLSVLDPFAQRLTYWEAESLPPSDVRVPGFIVDGQFTFSGGAFRAVIEGRDSVRNRIYALIERHDDTTRTLKRIARPAYATGDFPSCDARNISGYPLLSPKIVWTTQGRTLAVADPVLYKVVLNDGGHVADTVTRPIEPFATDSVTAGRQAVGTVMNGCAVPPGEVVRAFGYAPVVPLIAGLTLAPDGELFVEHRVQHAENRIDVFEGGKHQYEGSLPASVPMPAAFLDSTTFLAIGQDADGVPTIVAVRLKRTPGNVGPAGPS